MRGRKPKPTFLKLVSGNPGHRPLNLDEPEPSGDLIDPPPWFSARQRILWDETIRASPPGLLRLLDSTLLEVFVIAKSVHEHAAQKVEQLGGVVAAPVTKQPMKNPYLSILNQQAAIMTKCISEMGFSPSSRSRVKVVGKRKQTYFGKLKMFKPD